MDAERLSISEVAAASGLRPSALRYYEEAGLVASAERRGGRRYYDRSVLDRLGFIGLCQDAGFSIAEIGALLDGTDDRRRWRHAAAAKLDELDERLERLQEMRSRLAAALECGCADLDHCGLVRDARSRRGGTSGGRAPTASVRERR